MHRNAILWSEVGGRSGDIDGRSVDQPYLGWTRLESAECYNQIKIEEEAVRVFQVERGRWRKNARGPLKSRYVFFGWVAHGVFEPHLG